MPTRVSAGRWSIALVLAGALVAAGAADAIASASSNTHAMHLYASAQKVAGHYQGITFTGGGVSYEVTRNSDGSHSFRYDFGAVPRHYRRAVDHATIVMRHGKIVEEVDTLSAKGLPRVRVWRDNDTDTAIGKVLERTGCSLYFTNDTASFMTVGQPFGFADGPTFSAPYRSGGNWVLKSTYPLGGGTGHETDVLSASSSHWVSFSAKLKGGPYNGDHLSASSFGYHRHEREQTPAQLGRC